MKVVAKTTTKVNMHPKIVNGLFKNDAMPNTKSNNSILIKEDFGLNDKSLLRFMNAAMTTIIPITAFLLPNITI
ncbi:hypothetical protein [Methanobrevibacter sp.]|uniref:hypothetical protein n=1 Tax=Methanobrevibacter sp. TaxID=66852 RepID=UPI0025FA8315|nr:hypothetical protein [Methanobrevibacter sp.]